MPKSLLLFIFIVSTTITSAQLSVKDSIDHLLESTDEESYSHLKRALVLTKQSNFVKKETKVLLALAIKTSQIGEYLSSLDYFAQAELMLQEHHFPNLKKEFYLEKTGVLRQLAHYKEGIRHNKEAAQWFEEQKDTISLGLAYNNLGGIYLLSDNLKEAKVTFEKALLVFENTPRKNDAMVLANMASVYTKEKQYHKAIPFYQAYLKEARKKNQKTHEAAMLLNLGSAYGFLKDTFNAFAHYDTAMVLIEKHKIPDYQFLILQAISETYEVSGNDKKALTYYKKYKTLEEEEIGKKTQEQIVEWKIKYETERQENEIMNLQQAAKIKNQQYLLVVGSFVFLGMIGCFIFIKRISDFKKKKALHLTQQQLMESKLKNKALEQERLQEQLAFKNHDLTNLTLDISRKNEFSNQLLTQLNELVPYVPSTAKNHLNKIQLFVTNNLQINEELEVFQKSIEKINQDFYHKLLAQFPNLTPKDTELCGLIKLNRTNKEIAAIRSISVSSAKMARYRLRKKLGLESNMNIVHFLRDFS